MSCGRIIPIFCGVFGSGPAAPIVDDQTVLIEICSIFLIGADSQVRADL